VESAGFPVVTVAVVAVVVVVAVKAVIGDCGGGGGGRIPCISGASGEGSIPLKPSESKSELASGPEFS
jgi:hypothetical protein